MVELNNKTYTCPVDVALDFIGGKWKILILSHLHWCGPRSYSDIKKNLPLISEKMLSQQLKELDRDALVTKKVLSEKPYRVTYSLSDSGESLRPLFAFLSQWGVDYLQKNGIDYIKDQHLYK